MHRHRLNQPAQAIEECSDPLQVVRVRPFDDTRCRFDRSDALDILIAHMHELGDACLSDETSITAHHAYLAFVSQCIAWGDAHNSDGGLRAELDEWMCNETEIESHLTVLTDPKRLNDTAHAC